jgi:DNA repair exonuclease SbcCD ATPase subunit
LPQIVLVNRQFVSIELRREAAERFERSQIEELTKENEEQRAALESLQSKLEELQQTVSLTQVKLPQATEDIQNLTEDNRKLRNQLTEQRRLAEQRDRELADERELTADLKAQLAEVAFEGKTLISPSPTESPEFSELQSKFSEFENKKKTEIEQITTKAQNEQAKLEQENRLLADELDQRRLQFHDQGRQRQEFENEKERFKSSLEQKMRIIQRQKEYIDEMAKSIHSFPLSRRLKCGHEVCHTLRRLEFVHSKTGT